MTDTSTTLPGFVASIIRGTTGDRHGGIVRTQHDPIQVTKFGAADSAQPLFISRVHRNSRGSVHKDEIARRLASDPSSLTQLLPPFGAAVQARASVTAVADSMGFQPFFHTISRGSSKAVLSTSALVAARAISAGLDEAAVGVQALLGWQLGQDTIFSGIRKLTPGSVATLGFSGVSIHNETNCVANPIDLESAVEKAAALLRLSLNSLLDEHPNAVLQLTGGLDSRLLLSAIPRSRRRGLRAMTLDVPGSVDATIAGSIAERYGIDHTVHGLTDLSGISPADAWQAATTESIKLDAMADPVALAAQRFVERNFEQGIRISGLGGEIARGFYYLGRIRDRTYTRADAAKLASWRMFVNEAVEPGFLTQEYLNSARQTANDRVYTALRRGSDEWFRATDTLYARHRMQRWAGPTDVAVSDWRTVINPMLDHSFVDLAFQLAPHDKANSRFLAMLQVSLDQDLAKLPLNGRPAPAAYANPGPWRPGTDGLRLGRQMARKALQRLKGENRPPAGGEILAQRIVSHLRTNADLLTPLENLPYIRQDWIGEMLTGSISPRPSTVALLVNLLVALQSGDSSQQDLHRRDHNTR